MGVTTLLHAGLVLSSPVENPVGSSSHAQDSSHIKKQRKHGLVSAGKAGIQKAALKWLDKQGRVEKGLSRPVSERLPAPEQELPQQFVAGISDPSPKKKRSLLQKTKCGFKTDQRSSKKFRELLRPHGSSSGSFRGKAVITAEAHEGEDSKNPWPVLKRPKWQLFGGSAVIGAGIVALAMAKSQPEKSTKSFSGAGSNSGDCGNAGNGVGSGGGGGNGGGGGGGGANGGRFDPGMVSGSREEEAQQSKPAQPTSGLYVLASMSSSKYDSLEQEFRKVRNKMGGTIPASVASVNDVVQGDTDETVELFKGKAYINFENSKLNVELVREKAEKSHESDQTDEAVTKSDANTSQANEEATSSSTRQKPAAVVEDNSSSKDEEKGKRLNWLSGIVDSALLKAGAKTKSQQVLEEKERKELAEDVAALVLQQLGGDDGLAKSSETGALKRLQREAFADIMRVRERLDKLDLSLPELKRVADSVGIAKARLKGRVAAGGAFVLMQDISSYSSRSALEQVGLPAGLDVDFTFQTPFRDMDLLTTKCVAGQANFDSSTLGGPIRLEKLSYAAQVTDDVKFSFVPLGAEAKDVIDIVNPVQDQALTKFASCGPALFGHCKGSAIGATYRSLSTLMSVSEYLSGWGDSNGPLCLATLAQFIYQPSDHLILSLSGLNRFWPSPPLPSSAGLHWSEMRPFVLSKSTRSSSSALGTIRASDSSSFSRMLSSGDQWSAETPPFEPKGTAMQSLAVSGEVDLGGFASMGGWVQVERGDWLQDDEKRRLQWSLSIAKPTGNVVNWGVSIGSSRRDYWSTLKDEEANLTDLRGNCSPSQLQVEAFVKCDCGQGFSLQPGMLYILNKQCQTPALLMKAEWSL